MGRRGGVLAVIVVNNGALLAILLTLFLDISN